MVQQNQYRHEIDGEQRLGIYSFARIVLLAFSRHELVKLHVCVCVCVTCSCNQDRTCTNTSHYFTIYQLTPAFLTQQGMHISFGFLNDCSGRVNQQSTHIDRQLSGCLCCINTLLRSLLYYLILCIILLACFLLPSLSPPSSVCVCYSSVSSVLHIRLYSYNYMYERKCQCD